MQKQEETITQTLKLAGKVALVTGSGANIGEACAKALAKAGAKLVLADINLAGAQRVACLLYTSMRVGDEGAGWTQVTAELSLERSGPERYLSSFALFLEFVQQAGPVPDEVTANLIGRLAAELWTLRRMSMSTAAKLAAGQDPMHEAAIVKDLGTRFEQELPRAIQEVLDARIDLAGDGELVSTLSLLLQVSPSFSLRGGTAETVSYTHLDVYKRQAGTWAS